MPLSSSYSVPVFPGNLCKNDGLFLYGAIREKPFVHCYEQQAMEVVYGPSCKIEKEINVDKCKTDGVPLIPRRGGGGTVVLAPGMVITIMVGERGGPKDDNPKQNQDSSNSEGKRGSEIYRIFGRIHQLFINILAPHLRFPIEQQGISDLAIGGKKVLGSSLYLGQTPALYYYQSSLMVSSDTRLISTCLKHPPKEPEYRAGRSHNDFCTSLKKEGCNLSADDVGRLLSAGLKNL
jgi:lipoate---protein ligase